MKNTNTKPADVQASEKASLESSKKSAVPVAPTQPPRIDIFSLLCYNSGKEEARILLRKSKFLEAFVTLKIKQGLL